MNNMQIHHMHFISQLERQWQEQMHNKPQQWKESDGLAAKIKKDGTMNDFFGYTTVIPLHDSDRLRCEQAQHRLLERMSHRLVALLPETFHLTIHALGNERNTTGGAEMVRQRMSSYEPQMEQTFREIAERYAGRHIAMRSLGVSTNARDVVSIKYAPEAAEDYALLMDLYERIQELSPERSMYLPHVSLCYFRLDGLEQPEIDLLYQTMDEINRSMKLDIVLEVDELVYQMHRHMNDFPAIFAVKDFVNS